MCRNETNVPAVNIKEARKSFTLFFNSLSNRLRITNEFQSWSVSYDYTLSYQKSSQYLKS
jgi:hypothetical protein